MGDVISRQDTITRKAIAKLQMGCTGCIHYDQQQTALICRDCKRYYRDMYEDGDRKEDRI